MQRDEIDAVTVIWQPAGDSLTATLDFACGQRDENLDQIGLTHLAQVAVLDSIGAEIDTMTSTIDTSFTMTGTGEQVTATLAELCRALAEPSLDTLAAVAQEADPGDRFLDLDIYDSVRDPWGSLLARRLGASGLGLARWPTVTYTDFTADEVRAYIDRHFTAGNAVLSLTGPPPAGLRLPLPQGPRSTPRTPIVALPSTPSWYADEVVAPGIAVTAVAGPEALAVQLLLRNRIKSALDARGLDFWTTSWHTPVDAGRVEIGLSLHFSKPRPSDHAYAAATLWRELRRLAKGELTAEDLTAAAGLPTQNSPGPVDQLNREAKAVLFDVSDEPTLDQLRAVAGVSRAVVATAAVTWLRSATVVVPNGVEVELDGMTEISCPHGPVAPSGEVLRPSRWQRLRGHDERLILAADGFHLVAEDGTVHSFPIADALVIERTPAMGGKAELLLGNVRHGCLVDVTAFGLDASSLGDRLPPRRYRRAAD